MMSFCCASKQKKEQKRNTANPPCARGTRLNLFVLTLFEMKWLELLNVIKPVSLCATNTKPRASSAVGRAVGKSFLQAWYPRLWGCCPPRSGLANFAHLLIEVNAKVFFLLATGSHDSSGFAPRCVCVCVGYFFFGCLFLCADTPYRSYRGCITP